MKRILLLVFFLSALTGAYATHNKAGEITYRHISGLTYEITIHTYTDSGAQASVLRDKLEILWGDGTSDSLPRVNGPDANGDGLHDGEFYIGYHTMKNLYVGQHTYPGSSTYIISMEDLNRVGNVNNMPNSINTSFYIQTILLINASVHPEDNSPILTIPPVDNACVNKIFVHNPGAYDPDMDSLSYELDTSRTGGALVPPGYYIPAGISMNAVTGDFIWDKPTVQGWFNFAFRVVEWRNGFKLGYVTRDLLVVVGVCQDNPPELHPPPDVCVAAGDTVRFRISCTDPDKNSAGSFTDRDSIFAFGATFHVVPQISVFTLDTIRLGYSSGTYTWPTNCAHISLQPYTVFFKAVDDDPEHLADFKEVSVRVVGPAPKNVTASPSGSSIVLQWTASVCAQVVSYKIYRRNGLYTGTISCPCETGVPASSGYVEIATVDGHDQTSYVDDDHGAGLIHGNDYCYLIVAVFPDGALSCASEQVCAELKKDIPVITHVDILKTDASKGLIKIIWSMPTQIDSVLNPPPYHVKLYRSDDGGITDTLIDIHTALDDTIHFDTYNTVVGQLVYRTELYNDSPPEHLIGSAHAASSIFLSITPTDNQLDLSWNVKVPWTNYRFDVFRQNLFTALYDSIASTTDTSYSDKNLVNGVSYCYLIKSVGQYSGTGFITPIINHSQEKCAAPIDNIPPCAPVLSVLDDCKNFENFLKWNNPNNSCADDVVGYRIYYSPTLNGDMTLLITYTSALDTTLLHNELYTSSAGCYQVMAFDSANNESVNAVKICVDDCPEYSLPNVFTPDGNGINDFFRPFPYRFIESIDLQIFNRWGQQVFKTTNPDINWDGKFMNTSKTCTDGVYYYVCKVNAKGLDGIKSFELKGFVEMLNSTTKSSSN